MSEFITVLWISLILLLAFIILLLAGIIQLVVSSADRLAKKQKDKQKEC